jgi:2,4-dienoyl-CoA reductase-like NADH-dependent reductase (Old Yellow Enzyme family)
MTAFVPLSELDSVVRFRDHLAELGIGLDIDVELEQGPGAPLAGPLEIMGRPVGNRFCVHPMEGWDADVDGRPTRSSRRRWRALGRSGAKVLWNESIAVNPLGRSPVAVRRHPLFDETLGPGPDAPLLTDDEVWSLIGDYVRAAELAQQAGFDFVDLKSCHGYLSHELLSAFERPGDFGGPLENRTRFLREIIEGARAAAPGLGIAVRLSAFDTITHEPDERGVGRPITDEPFRYWFGTDPSGHHIDLGEPIALLEMLRDLSVELVSITGSSPYSVRHYQSPAAPRPGEHYINPENPLHGVARHLTVTASLKQAVPQLTIVGGGYSYLQQFLPHVAQPRVRRSQVDLIGIARMHSRRLMPCPPSWPVDDPSSTSATSEGRAIPLMNLTASPRPIENIELYE